MLTATVKDELAGLQATLHDYSKGTRRRVGRVVSTKGSQIILGNSNPEFGRTFPGMFERMRQKTPRPGEISEERFTALEAGQRGRFPVLVRPSVMSKAKGIMGGAKSGVFRYQEYNQGGGRRGIVPIPVKVHTRGKRRGERASWRYGKRGGVRVSRAKTARLLSNPWDGLKDGDHRLNTLQLAALLEINAREKGRGFAAAAFLPRRYRRISGATSGVRRVLVKNKSGQRISSGLFAATKEGAAFRMQATPDVLALPFAQAALAKVLRDVRQDTVDYLRKREARAYADSRKRGKGRISR